MDLNQQSQKRRYSSRDPLDRRVDKWIETGRQFVDGVAGNRPGKRRPGKIVRNSTSNLENMGRWVGDKIDWFLEDEDAWLEPWQSEVQVSSVTTKKPLHAISRRMLKSSASSTSDFQADDLSDQWPSEDNFRIDRWQRGQVQTGENLQARSEPNSKPLITQRRQLPRSSRRKD